MENYLKLPYEDYQKIRKTLDGLLRNLDRKEYHEVLYIGNILFEVTHNFDSGKPYLYSDDPTSLYLIERFKEYYPESKDIRVEYPEGSESTLIKANINYHEYIYKCQAGSDDSWWEFTLINGEHGEGETITFPFQPSND